MMYTDKAGSLRDGQAGHAKVEGMTDNKRIYRAICDLPSDFGHIDLLRLARELIEHAVTKNDYWRYLKAQQIDKLLDIIIADMEEHNDTNV